MADAVCQYGCPKPRCTIAVSVFRVLELHRDKIRHEVANITANIAAGQLFQRDTSTFEALENNFQQLSLLRVHESCLKIVDAEKGVFKRPDVFVDEIPS